MVDGWLDLTQDDLESPGIRQDVSSPMFKQMIPNLEIMSAHSSTRSMFSGLTGLSSFELEPGLGDQSPPGNNDSRLLF